MPLPAAENSLVRSLLRYTSAISIELYAMKDRRSTRQRVLKGATIIQSITTSQIECVMRNQTEHGAELKVPRMRSCPNSFQLYVAVDGHRL